MIIDDSFDSDKLVEFLAALIKDAGRKVFIPDPGQPAGAPQQDREGLGIRATRPDRIVLPAQL